MKKKRILAGLLGLALAFGAVSTLTACDNNKKDDVVQNDVTVTGLTVATTGEKVLQRGTYTPSSELKVTATFSDETTKDVTAYATFSKVDTLTYGTKTVTVTYRNMTATYSVEVEQDTKIRMNATEYATIKEALAAVPTTEDTSTYVITLPKGTYEENGLAYNGTATVKISGNTDTKYGTDVIIKGHGSDMTTEKGRSLLAIQGTGNIILENLTLKTDWSRTRAANEGKASNTQAEVLGTDTKGNTAAYNCSFLSNQDTIRTAGKAWFYGCYIEGDVDFLWMEQAGSVALYEKCEIVSVYDETATSHASYVSAPRMAKSNKVGKGLVIYNSTVKEYTEAKEKGQQTYLARNPWSSTTDYYNQVAYINATCTDIESDIWKGSATATDYDPTAIGWKMDAATATSLGYEGTAGIVAAEVVSGEFNGRNTIINRLYNVQKQKYEKDNANYWDVETLVTENEWTVDADSSKASLSTDTAGESTVFAFDGSADQSEICNGFTKEDGKAHYRGGNGATITVPVSGKCYVEVYGYYSGTVETKADTQDSVGVMFFNNGSTNAEIINTYAVYDDAAKSVVITAKGTTYITKVVVTKDTSVAEEKATGIEISASTTTESVGVPLTLSATITNKTATNKSVKWSSSDTSKATIDEYTGKVSFLNAGEVTFTATACDGSGVTATKTCNPILPDWTVAEWYTTDTIVATEDGADGIGNFNPNGSAYKALSKSYTFTNIAGQTVTTEKGLKLNSAGKLTIATTKANATLTVVIATPNTQIDATPVVKNGSTEAELVGTPTVNEDGSTTYVYSIPTAGSWDIERGNTQSENDPIIYVKCEYDNSITEATDLTFGTNGNYESATAFKIAATVANNGGNNAQVKNGTISFTVAAGAQVEVYANWGEAYTITLADGTVEEHDGTNVGNDGKRIYTYATKTNVVINCDPNSTGHNYFYWIKVTFPNA